MKENDTVKAAYYCSIQPFKMNSMSEDIVHKECGKNPATDPNVNALLLYWYIYMSVKTLRIKF